MFGQLGEWLFDSSGLTAHGFCLLWEPGLIWTYAIADITIALAYFSIPAVLVIVVRRRRDLAFGPLLWLFAAFILLCGATHWLDLATLWLPVYGLEAVIKAATAIVSLFTAAALWRFLPNLVALPSPEQLRQANAALSASREQLVQSQKMEAVGQLTGGIAHDFNNMLQVIVGSVQMMERRIEQGRVAELPRFLDSVRQASDAASRLTNRLLAFSRRQALRPQAIEPAKLVASLDELVRRTVGPEISVTLHTEQTTAHIVCDPQQLESSILNLAINARDAMTTGGTLSIKVAERALSLSDLPNGEVDPGKFMEIAVSDTGTGMSPEVLERVFEPFFTTKPSGQGTGLGLSQVYGFIRQSEGIVRIESEPGTGTTVKLYLRAHAQNANVAAGLKHEPKMFLSDLPSFAGKRILLVDDEQEVRVQIAEALREIGCDVTEAEDGAVGLSRFQQNEEFDLLVTDVGMPGMNGRQLADATRAIAPELPILLITGYAGAEVGALRNLADVSVLHKPFSLDTLQQRVATLLKAG